MKRQSRTGKLIALILWALIGCIMALSLSVPLSPTHAIEEGRWQEAESTREQYGGNFTLPLIVSHQIEDYGGELSPCSLSVARTLQGNWHKNQPSALCPLPSTFLVESPPTPTLLKTGIEHFQAERFIEAIASWQQALNAYTTSKDGLNRALILSNLSLAYQHLGQWQEAEATLNQSLNFFQQQTPDSRSATDWEYYGKALNAQGWLLWRQGQSEKALQAWKQTALAYESANHFPGIIGSQINQAKALQSLGLSVAAQEILERTQSMIQQQTDSQLQVMALQSLGNAFRRVGDLDDSQEALKMSLAIANQELAPHVSLDRHNAMQSAILLDLANTERAQWEQAVALKLEKAQTYKTAALEHYQQSAAIAPSTLPRLQANANLLSLLVNIKQVEASNAEQWEEIGALWDTLRPELSKLPPSRLSVEVQLNTVNSLLALQTRRETVEKSRKQEAVRVAFSPQLQSAEILPTLAQLLTHSIQQARQLQDRRAESLALGLLGNVYEQARQLPDAKTVTNQAIILAEAIQAPDVRYRWEWQLGRLYEEQRDTERAIAAYTAAFNTLKSVRSNLLTIESEAQFSFRDNVEPVYRTLVDLLLRTEGRSEKKLDKLKQAVTVIDELQLAELENFFRCKFGQNPNFGQRQNNETLVDIINQLDSEAAIVYPIILPNRIELILKLPCEELKHYTTNIEKPEVEQTIQELRATIIARNFPKEMLERASQIYDWIIRPLQTELSNHEHLKTLVFVLDGSLRNIPMSVLYDGEHYLLEKDYAIALLPSLQLFDLQTTQRENMRVLAAGVSEARNIENRRFGKLENVEYELNGISHEVSTQILLNSAFKGLAFKEKINSRTFTSVHIATHGKFSSDPNETFILAYDQLLKSQNLDNILRTESQDKSDYIDLLVLSACETAQGDNRATLGLAGIAVRAGALTTVSTLWQVNDRTTALLMQEFYKLLANSDMTKAEALHQAQLSLFKQGYKASPFLWSPYVLIGNWL